MTWYAWVLVAYVVFDRIYTVALIGRSIQITNGFAVVSLITGALIVWAILALAGAA